MTFADEVKEYLRGLPDMRRSTLLGACSHFAMSRTKFQKKMGPIKFRHLRRNERLDRFKKAVIEKRDITAVEVTQILGLSDEKSLNKYIKYHVGVNFTQFRQHILDGYYEM